MSVPNSTSSQLAARVGRWFVLVFIGALAGGISGWAVAHTVAGGLDSRWSQLLSRVTTQLTSTSSTSTTTTQGTQQIIPLEAVRKPVYPAVFQNRANSSMLPIVQRTGLKLTDPSLVSSDRVRGYGIALTQDGWLVIPSSLITGSVNDLGVTWRSQLYPVTKAVRDRATDLTFLKINVTDLPIAPFASPNNVVAGLPVWSEVEPLHLRPETIIAIDARETLEALPSERQNRRFLLTLSESVFRPGMAVWSEDGALVGITTSVDRSGTRVLPTSSIGSSLSQVLASQPIQHATLNVKGQEVATLISEGVRPSWPAQGVLVKQVSSTSTVKLLQEGDVLERMDRDAFDGIVDLGERLLEYRPGTTLTFRGTRKGQAFQVDILLQATTTGEVLK